MKINLLDTDKHEEVRFELLKRCEILAVEKPEWAKVFLLFDISREIGDLGKDLQNLHSAVESVTEAINSLKERDDT